MLNFVSQFEGELGIPIHAREFASALEKKINVKRIQLNKPFKAIDAPGLIFWYPHAYTEYNLFEKTYGYYIFEYNKIPKVFINEINQLDGICTASEWGKNVLIENGVNVKIFVIPGGVNTERFNSKKRKLDKNIFRFLHVGKAEERKGTKIAIRAFNEAFRSDPKIRLTISIDNPHIPGFTSEKYLQELALELKYPVDNIDIKHFIPEIKDLYDTHDCAIFPTMAEGIGLPIVEAMACGLPVIVTNNTGVSAYANENNAIMLNDLEEVGVYDPVFFPRLREFGTWMSPKVEELREKMIWAYGNQNAIKRLGEVAEIWMSNYYTWDLAADKFISEVLNED